MSDIASPAILQPPPRRAPGVKRLNSVPKMIGAGIVVVFIIGVGYTAIQRHLQSERTAAAEADDKKVEGSQAPAFLNAPQAHGEVQADLDRQLSRPTPPDAPPPAATQSGAPSTPPPSPSVVADQSGSDVTEQARTRAWQTYYQQRDELQAKRYEMNVRALMGGDQQGLGQMANGGALGMPGALTGTGEPILPTGQVAAAGGAPGAGGPYSTGGTDPNAQTGKQAFLRTPGDTFGLNEDLSGSVHPPKPDTIMEGTPIPGRLVDAATSDSPGQLIAEVMTNVCDSMTGNDLLIPQGTRIITTYDTAVSAGQDRIGTIAQRLIFPDTSSRQLGSMQIADQSGMAGLKDLLNTHFWDKFWATAMISLAGAGAQLAQPQQSAFAAPSPTSVGAGAMTQGFSQLGQAYAQHGLSIPNTIELRNGLPLVVKPNKDITLPPYVDKRGFTGIGGACS
jgi:type IV secretion system protein TrbI